MSATSSRRVSTVLHELGEPAWLAATNHPMVREIGAGTLPHEKFRHYFSQNILYLQDYARAIGLVVGKAPDRAAIGTLTRFLSQIVENEIPENVRFLGDLGGDPGAGERGSAGDLASMEPATYAYTRHLLYVAAQGDCAEGLAAVLPCQWSYGELAKPLIGDLPDDPIYARWIGMFGNQEYDALVADTTALLDRLVDPDEKQRMAVLSAIFERSTRYEVEFWDMAYGDPAQG
jgi:thiaminase (transcriptional activator TenA)